MSDATAPENRPLEPDAAVTQDPVVQPPAVLVPGPESAGDPATTDAEPAPEPDQADPASLQPGHLEPEPVEPGPVEPEPVEPEPVEPGPVESDPVASDVEPPAEPMPFEPAVDPTPAAGDPGDLVPGPEAAGDPAMPSPGPSPDTASPESDVPQSPEPEATAPEGAALEDTAAQTQESAPEAAQPESAAPEDTAPQTQESVPEPGPSEAAIGADEPAPATAPPVVPSPAALAGRLAAQAGPSPSTAFGRVAEDGTVYVRTPEGEREVGSYPGATPAEALAYFARKYDEANAAADLLLQRVTQTDLSSRDATDALSRLREQTGDLRAVGDLVALAAKVENIATALEARKAVESAERAQAREVAKARREEIVTEAEQLAGQPEHKVQWKASSARMRTLLEEWKEAQRQGPKLDRESEQALWHRLSSARNSFDKLRRVHFAQLSSAQAEAKAAKEELVAEAKQLAASTDWGATAGAFKRLMDRWRQAGRASRSDDDALWQQFKSAQDSFFAAKDAVAAAENEEYAANLTVKEQLLAQAQALLPVKNLDATKAALRAIQDKWDAAGKVPRSDMDRIEKAMRRVEAQVREADDRKWATSNPEVTARAESMVAQLEAAIAGLRQDLAKAEASGNQSQIAKAKDALAAREAWLEQARRGLG